MKYMLKFQICNFNVITNGVCTLLFHSFGIALNADCTDNRF